MVFHFRFSSCERAEGGNNYLRTVILASIHAAVVTDLFLSIFGEQVRTLPTLYFENGYVLY